MKLSIFTTVTSPNIRGDNVTDALYSYQNLADEVIVIDGSFQADNFDKKWMDNALRFDEKTDDFAPLHFKRKIREWPKEFSWEFIGQQFHRGYEACIGDWVIHADLDYIFHEKDFTAIRDALIKHEDAPALSFYKYQFILPDRYNLKSRLVIAVNKKKYGNRIQFNGAGDLCQPTLDGKDLKPSDVPESGIPFYNYEKLIKTKEQITDDVGRMDRAYFRHFGEYIYGDGTDNKAYEGWLKMMAGRFNKPSKHVNLEDHPKYVQDTIKNLTSDKWGYSGFGTLGENDYV